VQCSRYQNSRGVPSSCANYKKVGEIKLRLFDCFGR